LDVSVGEIKEESEDDSKPLVIGKNSHGLKYLIVALSANERMASALTEYLSILFRPRATQAVIALTHKDARQPGFELLGISQGRKLGAHLIECFLHCILGIPTRSYDREGTDVEVMLVRLHDCCQRGAVSLPSS
jgi:PHD/YefM family antitoxin component YafN of YafNO toxin-antitoxin module